MGFSSHESDSDQQRLAASLTALALRASLPKDSSIGDEWVVLSDRRPLSRAEFIDRLVASPKPLQCEAASREGRIEVSCAPAESSWMAFSRQAGERTVKSICPPEHIATCRIFVSGLSESLVIPLTSYLRWSHDYYVRFSSNFALRDPLPPEALAAGSEAYMRFSSSRGIDGSISIEVLPER